MPVSVDTPSWNPSPIVPPLRPLRNCAATTSNERNFPEARRATGLDSVTDIVTNSNEAGPGVEHDFSSASTPNRSLPVPLPPSPANSESDPGKGEGKELQISSVLSNGLEESPASNRSSDEIDLPPKSDLPERMNRFERTVKSTLNDELVVDKPLYKDGALPLFRFPEATSRPGADCFNYQPLPFSLPRVVNRGFGATGVVDEDLRRIVYPRDQRAKAQAVSASSEVEERDSFVISNIVSDPIQTYKKRKGILPNVAEFPPHSNKVYEYSIHGIELIPPTFKSSLDGYGFVMKQLSRKEAIENGHVSTAEQQASAVQQTTADQDVAIEQKVSYGPENPFETQIPLGKCYLHNRQNLSKNQTPSCQQPSTNPSSEQCFPPGADGAQDNIDDKNLTMGEKSARTINWNRHYYNGGEMGPSQGILHSSTPLRSARQNFVESIDKAKETNREAFEFCNKCKKRHISSGPPLTLQDRDTCYSLIPEWFPKDNIEEPWDYLKDLVNETVRLEEVEQGRLRDPLRPQWDKIYHAPHEKWRDAGLQKGGWWKCRSAGDGEDVPWREQTCKDCHAPKSSYEKEKLQEYEHEKAKHMHAKVWAPRFIENALKKQMAKDRAFVEARWKTEGI